MKKLLLAALVAVSMSSVAAADSIMVVSGATTITIASTGTTLYSNPSFNGWNITIAAGASNSPGLSPFGLDVTSLVTCSGGATCSTNPLDILYSDTNLNLSVSAGNFQTTYSATIAGNGTTSELAWANASNTLFALGGTNKIGSVGPFSGSGGFGTAAGGPAAVSPYSLTIEEIFTAASGNPTAFSADANVTAVPESSSLFFVGAGLLLLPIALKRRRKDRQVKVCFEVEK
jgi:hypothetical protein